MKVEFELDGYFPQMVQALKENMNLESDDNNICKTLVESWLIDHQTCFKKEYDKIIKELTKKK